MNETQRVFVIRSWHCKLSRLSEASRGKGKACILQSAAALRARSHKVVGFALCADTDQQFFWMQHSLGI